MRIQLNKIADINVFNKTCSDIYEEDIFVEQGSQRISAKSILGIYSLDLSQPIDVTINTDNKRVTENFYNYLKKWEVKE
ncbi:HPr family phosphocarrier protein [Bariatricus sp. SGI.019]|uniref:HPr family phosphocarrier protein n=1 Tax=Bariatricus sp. SGI.019 TaxID=3420548 RepID=UPI003D0202B4